MPSDLTIGGFALVCAGLALAALPGWLWARRLAPEAGRGERAVLAGGLALVTAIAATMLAAALPSGSTGGAVVAVVLVVAGLGLVAGGRRSRVSQATETPQAPSSWRSAPQVAAVAGSAVVCLVAVVAAAVVTVRSAQDAERDPRTAVGLIADLTTEEDGGPGRPAWIRSYDVEIRNHEGRSVTYEVEIVAPAEPPRREFLTVGDGAVETLRIDRRQAGGLLVRVYGGSSTEAGYREVRVGVR